jgi:hypothetical protein
MQLPEQQASQPGHKGFVKGRSGNPRGRLSFAARQALVLARARELAEELGGYDSLSPIEKTLIERAADLSLGKPRRYDQRIRRDNLISRILRDVLRRHGPPRHQSAAPSLADYVASKAKP